MKAKTVLTTILIMLLLILLALAGLFAYKKYVYKDTRHIGNWERTEDLTEYVRDRMQYWLGDAMLGDEADYGTDRVLVTVSLTLSEDGSFTESVDYASYSLAQKKAMEIAVNALTDFLGKRIEYAMPAFEGTDDLPPVAEMLLQSTGMTPEEYIQTYGPALLPELTSLEADFNKSGYYTMEGGVIAKSYGTNILYEKYVYADDANTLVITGVTTKGSAAAPNVVQLFEIETEDTIPSFTYPIVYKRR